MSGCAQKRELALVQMRLRPEFCMDERLIDKELISYEILLNKIDIIKKNQIFSSCRMIDVFYIFSNKNFDILPVAF